MQRTKNKTILKKKLENLHYHISRFLLNLQRLRENGTSERLDKSSNVTEQTLEINSYTLPLDVQQRHHCNSVWGRIICLINSVGTVRYQNGDNMYIPNLKSYIEINSRWIISLTTKAKSIKFLEENISLCFWARQRFP